VSRRLPEELTGVELEPLCVATRFSEAGRVEATLDAAGIDYTFEITPVQSRGVLSMLFGAVKKGVMFLVPRSQRAHCVELLMKEGLSNLLVD
jgi:hypothetical protein